MQSCSQKQSTSASLKVTGGFAITSTSGGLLVYLHNKSSGITTSASASSTTFVTDLDKGIWDFTLVAWDGSVPFDGNLQCGKAESINVEGAELTVNISLNASNCDSDTFSPASHRTAGTTNILKFYSCSTFTSVSGSGSNCDGNGGNDQGFIGSYRIRFLTTNGDLSTCIPATIATSDTLTTIKIPFGSTVEKLATVVETFTDANCTNEAEKKSFSFPDGLGLAANPTSDANFRIYETANLTTIFARHAGVAITADPDPSDFGTVAISSSDSNTFTLKNLSGSNITSISAEILNGGSISSVPFDFTGGDCTTTLSDGSTCTIVIDFSPVATGTFSRTLKINYNDGTGVKATYLPISGKTPALLSISVANSDFGIVNSDVFSANKTFTITNIGQSTASVITSASSNAAFFPVTGGTCVSTLAAGASCTVLVAFGPNAAGAFSESLSLNYNNGVTTASPVSQAMTGTGNLVPSLTITAQTSASYGTGLVAGIPVDRTFVITNTSAVHTQTLVSNSHSNAGEFSTFTTTCGGALPPLDTCSTIVRFAATTAGVSTNIFSYDYQYAGGTTQTASLATLTATVSPALITISDGATYNYTNVKTDAPASKTFTLTNSGATTATSLSVTGISSPYNFLGGSYPGAGGDCGIFLNASTSCTIVVQMTPTTYGAFNATIFANYNDGVTATSATRPITGRGVMVGNVGAFYPINGAQWNSYVQDTVAGPFGDSDTACVPGSHSACQSAGELRIISLPAGDFTSCTGLTFQDYLNALEWECDDASTPVVIRSLGFKKGKGLRDLLDATSWKSNYVTVSLGADIVFETPNVNNWWIGTAINNIDGLSSITGLGFTKSLPYNVISGVIGTSSTGITGSGFLRTLDLVSSNTIYTINSNLSVTALRLGASRISLVTLGSNVLSTMNTGSYTTCNTSTGAITSSNAAILVCVGATAADHAWIEVKASGPSSASGVATFLAASRFGRIHNSDLYNTGWGAKINIASKPNLVTESVFRDNSNNGMDVVSSTATQRFEGVTFKNNTGHGLATSSNNLEIVGGSSLNNGAAGINIIGGTSGVKIDSFNSLYNLNGIVNAGSSARISHSTISYNTEDGIYLNGSSTNKLHDLVIAANGTSSLHGGIHIYGTSIDNTIFNILGVHNYGPPLYFEAASPTSQKTTVRNCTFVNNNFGVYAYNSNYNSLVDIVASNNGQHGVYLSSSNYNQFTNIVATNTPKGFIFQNASTNSFYNSALIGQNATFGCDMVSGTGNTFSNSTCTSGITIGSKDLYNSFYGIGLTDAKNADAAAIAAGSGVVSFGSITDFGIFENLLRSWGPHGSDDPLHASNITKCNAGAGYCAVWDWSLDSGDSQIRNKTGDGTSSNAAFTPSSPCPAILNGSVITADQQTTVNTFLTHAVELSDSIGDDDGLCESSETCVYAPNFGVYQGHGAFTSSCTFSNGTLTGITMLSFPTNGL